MAAWSLRLAAVVLFVIPFGSVRGEGLQGGIGVLGDSYSDEYQFYSPDRSKARNWVEILAETRKFNFGEFTTKSREEPRNQGYAYNWARSEATTDDMIAAGQHTGLAAQVARGEVGLAVVFIGGNDFIAALKSSDPPAAAREVTPRAIRNVREAVHTLLNASRDVRVVVATVPDVRDLPEFAVALGNGQLSRAWADSVTVATRRFNSAVRAMVVGEPRIAVADLDLYARVANLVSADAITFGGRRIDRSAIGNGPECVFLADRRHAGTVGQGMLARILVDTINARFGAGIEALSDREILEFAQSASTWAPRLARARVGSPSREAVLGSAR
jgi:hypothetical protein